MKMESAHILRLEQVSLKLGAVQALRNVSLDLYAGQAVALVGGNGSGKSSLLRLLQGLVQPSAGSLQRTAHSRMALVHQRPWMLRTSVLRNVALAAWLQGQAWQSAKISAMQALSQVELETLSPRLATALSGGQTQRLAVARALAAQADTLLLDEPTSSLSPHAKAEMEQLMARLTSQGKGIVFASHNLGQVKRLAQRVIALREGQIVFDGLTQDYFSTEEVKHP